MKYCVFDLEADNLLDSATIIHCFSATVFEDKKQLEKVVLTEKEDIVDFMNKDMLYIAHNAARYDIPLLEKLYNFKFKGILIDTLPLSWYLYPKRQKHGLESWGESVGVPKPYISDWENLSLEDYVNRCNTDVEINEIIFHIFLSYLEEVYKEEFPLKIMRYLTWKMECAAEQELNPLKIDVKLCENTLADLYMKLDQKKEVLSEAMPELIKYSEKKKPSKLYTVKGDLTKAGAAWLELLFEKDLPADYDGVIKVEKQRVPPNPLSTSQLKDWLFSLGWAPTIHKDSIGKAGNVKAVPQLQNDNKKLCPNILKLAEVHSELNALKDLFMLQHRIGIFEGYLQSVDKDGYLTAKIAGLTNTLRFKHMKPLVNLPSVYKPYGEQIRGAIISNSENHILCGSDMVGIEGATQDHYMSYFDSEYVKEKRVPGFDSHLDIAVLANLLSADESQIFKELSKKETLTEEEDKKYNILKQKRTKAKLVNFSALYGASPIKISKSTGMEIKEAEILHKTFWKRNAAVKKVAAAFQVKEVRGQLWLYNPVSRLYYSLRNEKDRFSTGNQSTAVYCFDLQVKQVREAGIIINMQYHDKFCCE